MSDDATTVTITDVEAAGVARVSIGSVVDAVDELLAEYAKIKATP